MGAVYEAADERLQVTVAIKETFSVEERLRKPPSLGPALRLPVQ
jgi:hypothetical protein